MRLGDLDELRKKWIWGSTDRTTKVKCIELCDLDDAPTVDAVEVVRCKDCKHRPCLSPDETFILTPRTKKGFEDFTCPYTSPVDDYYNRMPKDDDFCSRGERK